MAGDFTNLRPAASGAQGLGGALKQINDAAPASPLVQAFAEQADALAELNALMERLCVKLEPLLTPHGAGQSSTPTAPAVSIAPAVDMLKENTVKIRRQNAILLTLLDLLTC